MVDEFDQTSSDIQPILERAEDELIDRDESLEKAQDSLEILSTKQLAQLYKEEDIPYDAAVEFEEMVDQMRVGAGLPRYFDNLPVNERPSEMYRNDGFWTSRRKFVAGGVAAIIGTGVLAYDAGNYAKEDTPDRGGVRLPFGSGDIDGGGELENHRTAEGKPPAGGQNGSEPTRTRTSTGKRTPTGNRAETATSSSVGSSDYRILTASVNSDQIGDYLEGLSRVERDEWEALWNAYNKDENEFYPESDLGLARVDIRYFEDPTEASNYRAVTEDNGRKIRLDPVNFEHDETAREALEYFGELDE